MPIWLVILLLVAYLGFAFWVRMVMDNPRREFFAGFAWHLMRLYSRFFHRTTYIGLEHTPRVQHPEPMIVVSNHTAGVDPILIQAPLPYEVRWVMTADMKLEWLNWFWDYAKIIFVDRKRKDSMGPREAIAHVKAGGTLGIFPEGGLERPPRQIRPFMSGVGLMIKRTGVPVLPVVVSDTPIADEAWTSLYTPSRSRVEFKEPIRYEGKEWTAERIAEDLRRRFLEWTGWPANDHPPVSASGDITPESSP